MIKTIVLISKMAKIVIDFTWIRSRPLWAFLNYI